MWQQPVDAGAISERGRKGAAEECARQLVAQLKERGCKEEFTPNPTLLLEGQVRAASRCGGVQEGLVRRWWWGRGQPGRSLVIVSAVWRGLDRRCCQTWAGQ